MRSAFDCRDDLTEKTEKREFGDQQPEFGGIRSRGGLSSGKKIQSAGSNGITRAVYELHQILVDNTISL